jgi:SAM-dependent methyltransferase
MFETYKDIFNQRGDAYHAAMTAFPDARNREFREILDRAAPAPGEVVLDLPSGGGYLRRHVRTPGVRFVEVETSSAFHALHQPAEDVRSVLCDLDDLDIDTGSVDVAVSLAGLHHAPDLPRIFDEIRRALKPAGRLCLADVRSGSPVDGFLNRFVHEHSSMGHEGDFLDDRVTAWLAGSGFAIESDAVVPYTWDFPSVDAMVRYVTLLFGLDRATPEQVRDGIAAHLGYETGAAGCRMHWELRFLGCRRKA